VIFFLIVVFIVLEYLRPSVFFPPLDALHLTAITSFILATAVLLSGKGFSKSDLLRNFNVKTMIVYVALIIISGIAARVRYTALLTFRMVIGYILAFIFMAKYLDTFTKVRNIFLVLVLVHLTVILINIDTIADPSAREYLRAGYFMGDGNDFALALNIVVPMGILLYQTSTGKISKLIYSGVLLIFLLGIIATQSRGGSIGLAAVAVFLWIHSRKKMAGLAVLLVGIIIVVSYSPQVYWDRMSTITSYDTEASAYHRILAWKSAVRMAIDDPLTGIGPGGFQTAFGLLYRPPGVGRTDLRWMNTHSIYFKLLAELGFPGLIVLLTFIFRNLWVGGRISRSLSVPRAGVEGVTDEMRDWSNLFTCLNASMVGFAVSGAFLSAIYYPHLYILVGIITASQIGFSKLSIVPITNAKDPRGFPVA